MFVCLFVFYIFVVLNFFFPEDFDPAAIAEKIRIVADKLNDDVTFKAALSDFKKAAAQEVGYTHAQCESRICWHLMHHSDGVPRLPSSG